MLEIFKNITSIFKNDKFLDLFKGKERLALEFQESLLKSIENSNYQQQQINLQDSKSRFSYVASWRPTIGYICAIGLFYEFFLRHILNYIILLNNPNFPIPPSIDISQLLSIILAMLGMAGYRTFEKLKNKN